MGIAGGRHGRVQRAWIAIQRHDQRDGLGDLAVLTTSRDHNQRGREDPAEVAHGPNRSPNLYDWRLMERRAIDVRGTVQGVGFRPFVHALASRLGLAGFVRNTGSAVSIEVEGDRGALDAFERELCAGPPPLPRIESVTASRLTPLGAPDFPIAVPPVAHVA